MEEKKIVMAYTVKRYEDGSVDVADAELEGVDKCTSEEAYKDIEDVAQMIKFKRYENAAFVGAYNGTAKFYQDVNKQQTEEKPEE